MNASASPASPSTATPVSFEFFPPNTPAGHDNLRRTRVELQKLNPAFFSVTYGAGGSTQERTRTVVSEIAADGLDVAPHISCVGASRSTMAALLDDYRAMGIRRVVALRGDLPSGMVGGGEFRYASDLVRFIRQHCGKELHIEVAAYPEMHPQAASPEQDLRHFVDKVAAGADSAITQYFYTADAYFDFVERARRQGVTIPIVPGIMPINNYTQLMRFSETCGAEIPRWIRLRLAAFHDDLDGLRAFGREIVARLCAQLLAGGAPGLHFYTLNQAPTVAAIWQQVRPGAN